MAASGSRRVGGPDLGKLKSVLTDFRAVALSFENGQYLKSFAEEEAALKAQIDALKAENEQCRAEIEQLGAMVEKANAEVNRLREESAKQRDSEDTKPPKIPDTQEEILLYLEMSKGFSALELEIMLSKTTNLIDSHLHLLLDREYVFTESKRVNGEYTVLWIRSGAGNQYLAARDLLK